MRYNLGRWPRWVVAVSGAWRPKFQKRFADRVKLAAELK
jgi:hypothetical protein